AQLGEQDQVDQVLHPGVRSVAVLPGEGVELLRRVLFQVHGADRDRRRQAGEGQRGPEGQILDTTIDLVGSGHPFQTNIDEGAAGQLHLHWKSPTRSATTVGSHRPRLSDCEREAVTLLVRGKLLSEPSAYGGAVGRRLHGGKVEVT